MEKVKYRYNRWRLALGRLVNLRYINRWIIFCADLFISLCVSLIGVLGLLSIMHVYISGISVLKVGIASFVASILSFLTFKVYHAKLESAVNSESSFPTNACSPPINSTNPSISCGVNQVHCHAFPSQ